MRSNNINRYNTQEDLRSAYLNCIAACGAAAERKNPLISLIAAFDPLSTLDDFKGKG